jgi:hypothetical protein
MNSTVSAAHTLINTAGGLLPEGEKGTARGNSVTEHEVDDPSKPSIA